MTYTKRIAVNLYRLALDRNDPPHVLAALWELCTADEDTRAAHLAHMLDGGTPDAEVIQLHPQRCCGYSA